MRTLLSFYLLDFKLPLTDSNRICGKIYKSVQRYTALNQAFYNAAAESLHYCIGGPIMHWPKISQLRYYILLDMRKPCGIGPITLTSAKIP